MKLIWCPHCHHLFSLSAHGMRQCDCGRYAGKYIDQVTAVVNEGAVVVGIDNNSFLPSCSNAIAYQKEEYRMNFYFVGWIPNGKHDGQVIFVTTIEEVENYKTNIFHDIPDISDHSAMIWCGVGHKVHVRKLKNGKIETFIETWKEIDVGRIESPRKWLGDFDNEEVAKKAVKEYMNRLQKRSKHTRYPKEPT